MRSLISLSASSALAVALSLAAIQPAEAADRNLRIAYDIGDLSGMDPHRASSHVDRAIAAMVFNGLVRLPAGNANVASAEPDLAKSWSVSEDGRVWTFQLRDDVRFQPWGNNPAQKLTAEDVVFSLTKAADVKRSAYSGEYAGFKFTAVDDTTVRIETPVPLSETLMLAKLMNYGGGFIISKAAYEAMGDGFAMAPVGTGPFMVDHLTPKSSVTFKANPNYFRGAPKLPGVELLFMPDVSARGIGIRTGELDIIEGSSEASWVSLMRRYPNVEVKVFGPGSASILYLNMKKPPLNDLRVRQAIAYALSREAVVAAIGPETAMPLYAPIPGEYLPGGLTTEEVKAAKLDYPHDIAKAKELLREAGYPDGISLDVIHTELAVMLRPMENVQAQLRAAGIALNLRVVDHPTYHSMIRDDASQIVHYMAWRPNPDIFLSRFYHSAADITTGTKKDTNFSHYAAIDALVDEARSTIDAKKQAELWREASIKILQDLPVIPVFQGRTAMALNSTVQLGYDLNSNLAFFVPITERTDIVD